MWAKDVNRGWIETMREMTGVIKRMCKNALWEIILKNIYLKVLCMKVLCVEERVLFRRHETLNESFSVNHPHESWSEGPQRPPKQILLFFILFVQQSSVTPYC